MLRSCWGNCKGFVRGYVLLEHFGVRAVFTTCTFGNAFDNTFLHIASCYYTVTVSLSYYAAIFVLSVHLSVYSSVLYVRAPNL